MGSPAHWQFGHNDLNTTWKWRLDVEHNVCKYVLGALRAPHASCLCLLRAAQPSAGGRPAMPLNGTSNNMYMLWPSRKHSEFVNGLPHSRMGRTGILPGITPGLRQRLPKRDKDVMTILPIYWCSCCNQTAGNSRLYRGRFFVCVWIFFRLLFAYIATYFLKHARIFSDSWGGWPLSYFEYSLSDVAVKKLLHQAWAICTKHPPFVNGSAHARFTNGQPVHKQAVLFTNFSVFASGPEHIQT